MATEESAIYSSFYLSVVLHTLTILDQLHSAQLGRQRAAEGRPGAAKAPPLIVSLIHSIVVNAFDLVKSKGIFGGREAGN
jgi:hypothetical protein